MAKQLDSIASGFLGESAYTHEKLRIYYFNDCPFGFLSLSPPVSVSICLSAACQFICPTIPSNVCFTVGHPSDFNGCLYVCLSVLMRMWICLDVCTHLHLRPMC